MVQEVRRARKIGHRQGAIKNLAVCMIVRNEEVGIIRALESVRGLVNEIVVAVDASTTDRTWERVADWLKEWDSTEVQWILLKGLSLEDVGFAACRNHALQHVVSEWCLILDADESFPAGTPVGVPGKEGKWEQRLIRSHDAMGLALAQMRDDIDMLILPLYMLDDEERQQSWFYGERCIRLRERECRDCGGTGEKDGEPCKACNCCEVAVGGGKQKPHFHSPVHNYVAGAQKGAEVDAPILHTRKHRSSADRAYRAKQRLRTAEKFLGPNVENDPDDTRSLFYLAGSYAEAGVNDKGQELYRKYLAHPKAWAQERYQAAVFLSRTLVEDSAKEEHFENRQALLDEAREVASHHIGDNWKRAELYYCLGQIAQDRENWKEAIFWYETAAKCDFVIDSHFVETAVHTWLPRIQMAVCHFALGDMETGYKCLDESGERGAPEGLIQEAKRLGFARYGPIHKLAVFVNPVGGKPDDKFIRPFIEEWRHEYQVNICSDEKDVDEVLDWADAAWFEFAGPLLIKATQGRHRARMIVRLHGHEIHAGYVQAVDWTKVDTVIFVAEYLRDIAIQQAPALGQGTQLLVIPGGVQHDRFTISEGKQGNKIAMAGYINAKKAPLSAIEILHEAKKTRPDMELHICGTVQDSRTWLALGNLIGEYNLRAMELQPGASADSLAERFDIYFYPWQDDLNVWFADKDYVLSTSIEESLHYSVAQGMAAGLRPVIRCWLSARDFYKPEWIYKTIAEAVGMLQEAPTPDERKAYRNHVRTRLSHTDQARAIRHVLARRTVAIPTPDPQPWRFEHAVADAFTSLGFAPATPDQADIVFCLEGAPKILTTKDQTRIVWNAAQIVGRDRTATTRRNQLRGVAQGADLLVTGTIAAAETVKAKGAIYQGGAWTNWTPKGDVGKIRDVGFYGVANARRRRRIGALGKALVDKGYQGITGFTSYDPDELRRFVEGCKIVLNVHWTEHLNAEARIAEVLSVGTFLLTERVADGHPFPRGLFEEWETPEELLEKADYYLTHEDEREAIARRGHDYVWENLRVEQQVSRVLELAGVRWAEGATQPTA